MTTALIIIGIIGIIILLGFAVEFLSEIIFQLKSLRSQIKYFAAWYTVPRHFHCRSVKPDERMRETIKKEVENLKMQPNEDTVSKEDGDE